MSKKIAYFGPEATFTHEAALKYFSNEAEYLPAKQIKDIFTMLDKNLVEFGVVPIENSTGGSIADTLDLFIATDLKVYDQITMEIKHNLLKAKKTKVIKKIFGHPQAFRQCRAYLENNYPDVELIEMLSNAEGANLAQSVSDSAAIAPILCAEVYNLEILAEEINDNKPRCAV